MTKRIKKQIRLHLENINIGGGIGSTIFRIFGLYKRGVKNAMDLQLNEYDVPFRNLSREFDGFRILVLADLHIDGKIDMVKQVRKKLSRISADIYCLLGDYRAMVRGDHLDAIEKMTDVISAVNGSNRCFGIRGNHDSQAMIKPLSELGIRMLMNEALPIERNGDRIWLVGVDDPHFYQTDDMEAAMAGVPKTDFKILLAHSPEIHWQAAAAGIDLYLCGHTHGGQVCSKKYGPIIVNARDSRLQARGFWKYENMKGFTSTGVGTSAIPVRFNCPPEIAVLTLECIQ